MGGVPTTRRRIVIMPIVINLHIHQMAAGTSWWTIAAAVAAAVAAVASLCAVRWARRTVADGREAHSAETAQRADAILAEITLQRLVHASRLTDVQLSIARAVLEEEDSQEPSIIRSLQAQLRAQLAAFGKLGGTWPCRSSQICQLSVITAKRFVAFLNCC